MAHVKPDRPVEAPAEASGTAPVSTGVVARRLGVAPTTLRSWERRYAIGPASREDGRHRRWTAEDIARLERMCRLTARGVPPGEAARAVLHEQEPRPGGPPPAPGPDGPPSPGHRTTLPLGDARRGLARAAERLDAPAVEALLDETLDAHGLVTAWQEVVAPVLHAVGRKWATSGERYVEVEHLLSWHVSSALRRVRPVGPSGDTPPALLACVPGEQHSLPVEALTAALGEHGVPVRMFGPALPAEALYEAVRRVGPSAVVLWAQSRSTADRALIPFIAGIAWGPRGARIRPALLLAGPGWAGTPHIPGTARPHDLRSALDTVAALVVPAPGHEGASSTGTERRSEHRPRRV
ncbi:MerR family transcriptional regulator [Streptomyces sp. NPDC002004]